MNRLFHTLVFTALITVINMGAGDAKAQSTAQEYSTDAIEHQLKTFRQTSHVSIMSQEQCPTVAYQDLLGNPDDIRLNYCYARQKIEQGDMKSATATLERLLLLEPGHRYIRILYASALYRMDAVNEARTELEAIKSLKLFREEQALVDSYISQVDKKQRRFRQSLTLAAGAHYDTNRNAAPENNTVLVGGSPFTLLTKNSRKDNDIGILGLGRYDLEYDFGKMQNHTALGSLTYLTDDQVTRDELDINSFSADAGARFDLRHFDLTTMLEYTNIDLSKEKFYNSIGVSVRADKSFAPSGFKAPLNAWLASGLSYESYRNISENSSLRFRTGRRLDVQAGSSMQIAPQHLLSATLDYAHKEARVNYQSYNYWNATLGHIWALGYGQYLSSNLSYGVRSYQGSDPFVTGNNSRDRHEKPLRFKTTYSVPVSTLMNNHDIEFLKTMNVSATAEYFNQHSNIENYDYENVRGQILITKRFSF